LGFLHEGDQLRVTHALAAAISRRRLFRALCAIDLDDALVPGLPERLEEFIGPVFQ
jgi:hypothetical protein